MRWRELCKKYRNTVNHNDLYNAQKTCQYFDDLNNLFGIWDSSATVLLIKHLQASGLKCRGQTGGTHTRYRVWDQIRQNLLAYGYKFTADQVQGRWNALVTLYQGMVDHNSKSNNEPISIAFKDYVEQIYKYSPEASSRRRKIKKKQRKPRTLRSRLAWMQIYISVTVY
nr:uncharacterized protein LOC128685939 [Cherax quadricarinatus]